LRRDLRRTVREGSAPGTVLSFLGRGCGILGRMYCDFVSR
jgi:hypothetical protein